MEHTLAFLKKLKSNNNREWFDKNKNLYLQAKEEFEKMVDEIILNIQAFDKKITPDLKAKDCVFRIYKDVRFSKDKSPYKTNMGAVFNPGGKKAAIIGYYLHMEPRKSFFGGGCYMPDAEKLQAIRQEIDYNAKDFLKILENKNFKKFYKGLDDEGKLVNPPKGFDKTNPHVDILKNKHFVVSHAITDKEVLDKTFKKTVSEGFKAMQPLLEFLRGAVE